MSAITLDVEVYRRDPERFLKLPESENRRLLQEVCGKEEYFVFRKSDDAKLESLTSSAANAIEPEIDYHSSEENWLLTGMLMQFFRYASWGFRGPTSAESYEIFLRTFEFGCFGIDQKIVDTLSYQNGALEWCYGLIGPALIEDCLEGTIADREFTLICERLQDASYTIDGASFLLREIGNRSEKYPERVSILMNILNQKYFRLSVGNAKNVVGPTPYAYLIVTRNLNKIEISPALKLAKPIWTRQKHKAVAFPGFGDLCRQIIGMQKFRNAEFTLHKDLVDTILRNVFELHLGDLEKKAYERWILYHALAFQFRHNPNSESVQRFCIEQRVSIKLFLHPGTDWIDHSIRDVVDRSMGYLLRSYENDSLDEDLRRTLDNLVFRLPSDRGSPKDVVRRGTQIERFCAENQIPLWDLFKPGPEGVKLRWNVNGELAIEKLIYGNLRITGKLIV